MGAGTLPPGLKSLSKCDAGCYGALSPRQRSCPERELELDQEDALQPVDRAWLDTPEDWVLGRAPVSEANAELERMDRDVVQEARRLGFELFGWSKRRDYSGLSMYVAHFVDDDGIELRVMAPRVARSETLWELIAQAHDGRTFVIPAPQPYGLVESERDDDVVVLARRTPLADGYHYLRRAIDHHLSGVKGQLRRLTSNVESLQRLERLERRASSRLARLQRLGYVGGVWLGAGAGVGISIIAVLLILLL